MEFSFEKEVCTAHLKAAGWEIGNFEHCDPFDNHMLYVCDYRNGKTNIFSIKKEDFSCSNIHETHRIELLVKSVSDQLLRVYAAPNDQQENSKLLHVLAGYVKST